MKTIKLPLKLFALVACLSFALSAGAYSFKYGDVYYLITSGNTVEVTYGDTSRRPNVYNTNNTYKGKIAIPPTVRYRGKIYNVTAIGDHAFDFSAEKKTNPNSGLTCVTIPNTVTRIGKYAFAYCYGISDITIPSSVTTIDNNAFSQCPNLELMTCLAKTPPTLGGANVFPNPQPLLYVPKGCMDAYYSSKGWKNCTVISEVYLDFGQNGIYYNTTGNNTVEVTCGQEYGSEGWGCYNLNCYFGDVMIPSTVSYLDKIYTVTAIGDHAFDYAVDGGSDEFDDGYGQDLKSVTIPQTVTRIGKRAFKCCNDLEKVTCMATTPPTMAVSTAFENSVYENATLLVPKGCVGAYMAANGWKNFMYIEELPYDFMVDGIYYKITSNNTVEVTCGQEYGGEGVWFYNINCYFDVVNIPSTVTYDGKTYTVTAIGAHAFDYSMNDEYDYGNGKNFHGVTIPETVARVYGDSFKCCNDITTVTCLAKTPPIGAWFESDVYSGAILYVPRGTKKAYASATGWKEFMNIMELCYDFVADGIYYNITGSNTVEVTYGQECGGEGFWYYNRDCYFGDIIIPSSVTYENKTYRVTAIGAHAFDYSDNDEFDSGGGKFFTSVVIPPTVTSIASDAFKFCSALKSVTCLAKTPPSGAWFESAVYSNATLRVLSEFKDAYKSADGWKQFSKIFGVSIKRFPDRPSRPGRFDLRDRTDLSTPSRRQGSN